MLNISECTFGGNMKPNKQLRALMMQQSMMIEEKFLAARSLSLPSLSASFILTTTGNLRELDDNDRRLMPDPGKQAQ